MWNLPNILTVFRIVCIPLLVAVFFLPWEGKYLSCALIFSLAAITDWLDGYLARRLDQQTPFGAFLDPVADKLIVSVALLLLLQANASLVFVLPVIIIISREIVISALREWMAEIGQRANVAVSQIGKIKTTFQMTAIIVLLLINPQLYPGFFYAGIALLYVAASLTLWSMWLYLKAAWPTMSGAE